MKAKDYSTLQKTYDQSHLTCSTAVYYESQGNKNEALRCWRECLSQLQGHNAAGYRPSTETQMALLQSLKSMQDQCQERIEALQVMLTSKKEARDNQERKPGSNPGKFALVKHSPTNTTVAPAPSPIPPALLERVYTPRASTVIPESSSCGMHSARSLHSTRTIPLTGISRISRTPSPEKRTFLSTLRSAKKERAGGAPPNSEGVAAVRAAALAWNSLSRVERETLACTLSNASAETVGPMPKNDGASGTTSNSPYSLQTQPIASNQHRNPPSLIPSQEQYHPPSIIPSFGNPAQPPLDSVPPSPPPHNRPPARSSIPSCEPILALQASHNSQYRHQLGIDTSIPPIAVESSIIFKRSVPKGLNSSLPREPVRSSPQISQIGQNIHREDDDVQALGDDISSEQSNRIAKALKRIGRGVDKQAALQVANEIVVQGDAVKWDDIAGLDAAKQALKEAVVYPFLRPDLFSGLREPARGMLLFGPPGTGKTMIARAVATESKSTFFSISASSLTSKYLGESEKLVRALFALAKALAPSIIFVDEIDSLLSSRNGSGEHEATRRIKTEFLIQWSDLTRAAAGNDTQMGDASRVLVLAATNLPWAIDDAARRRFVRRQYIPLPGGPTRKAQLLRLLNHQKYQLNHEEIECLVRLTDGFSGSDLTALAKDAAMGPLRSLGEALLHLQKDDIRPITFLDFESSLGSIKPSVSKEGLQAFEDWAKSYGERA